MSDDETEQLQSKLCQNMFVTAFCLEIMENFYMNMCLHWMKTGSSEIIDC